MRLQDSYPGRWMEKALQQTSPQPNTHEVTWYELDFEAVEVKINDGSLLEKQSNILAIDRLSILELTFYQA